MISRALVKQGDIRAFLVHPEVDKWLPEAGMLKGDDWRLLAAGMDILRTGIESIDSFDAKSYEYRIEFLGVRFDANRMWCFSFDIRIEHGTFYSLSNRTGPSVRSKIDRFGRTSDAVR
jgi:hypothetical protein